MTTEAYKIFEIMREAVPIRPIRVTLSLSNENGPIILSWHATVCGTDWFYRGVLAKSNLIHSQILIVCEDAWMHFCNTVEREHKAGFLSGEGRTEFEDLKRKRRG